MRIDGHTFEGHPIQVKEFHYVGRIFVGNFEISMRRKKAKKGVIVTFNSVKEPVAR